MPKAQKLVPVSTVQVVPQDDVQTRTASVGRVHAASEVTLNYFEEFQLKFIFMNSQILKH
jgi:hypothetical protein